MTNRDYFYKLFWQQKSCYNLFLLSKEELLDTQSFTLINRKIEIPFPRIIISNFVENDIRSQIDIRNTKRTSRNEDFLQNQIDHYTPLIFDFLDNHFGKAVGKITEDFKEPQELIGRILQALIVKKGNFEEVIIEQLHHYGFAGKHIKTFDELETYYKTDFVRKKIEDALSDGTIYDVLTFLRNIKELYLGELYKGMYASNQVLVNNLNAEDNFESRINLFELLFEAELISYGSEDVFVECHHCDPGMYKGSLNVKLKPKKLKQLTCPICQKEVTYFASFDIHQELFNIIKAKDGLLHDALIYLLEKRKISFRPNLIINELEGLEIDCVFEINNTIFIVETKMFKLNTETRKLATKIKRSVRKLDSDTRILQRKIPNDKKVKSILLVNITNEETLMKLIEDIDASIEIVSLFSMKKIIEESIKISN